MRPWLIETGIDTKGTERLIASLIKRGVEVTSISWLEEMVRMPRPPGVFHGSIQSSLIARDLGWHVYGMREQYRCVNYYPKFGGHLLNNQYIMLPFGELLRLRRLVESIFGTKVFVRPDSNEKVFTGQVVYTEANHWEAALAANFGGYDDLPRNEMVVLAHARDERELVAEYRSIVVDGKVVTTSRYCEMGECSSQTLEDPESDLVARIQRMVVESGYRPDIVWVLDTCRTNDGKHHVLEVGSFSAASLYGNDTEALVDALLPVMETA